MSVKEKPSHNLNEFISSCKQSQTRLVKLTEYAFVEPGDVGAGAIGMIGKERLVLTAFLKDSNELLRWQTTREANSMVTIVAGTDRGFSSGTGFAEKAASIKGRFEIEGIQVVEGEWTKEELERLLDLSE